MAEVWGTGFEIVLDPKEYAIAQAERARNALKWTTTEPTEPGWYWAFGPYDDKAFVVHAIQYQGYAVPYIVFMGDDELKADYEMTHWLGPLPTPEPPVDVKAE